MRKKADRGVLYVGIVDFVAPVRDHSRSLSRSQCAGNSCDNPSHDGWRDSISIKPDFGPLIAIDPVALRESHRPAYLVRLEHPEEAIIEPHATFQESKPVMGRNRGNRSLD